MDSEEENALQIPEPSIAFAGGNLVKLFNEIPKNPAILQQTSSPPQILQPHGIYIVNIMCNVLRESHWEEMSHAFDCLLKHRYCSSLSIQSLRSDPIIFPRQN